MLNDAVILRPQWASTLANVYPTCGCAVDFSQNPAVLVEELTDLRVLCFTCAIKQGVLSKAMEDPTSFENMLMKKADEANPRRFEELLAASSFGTPGAKALRDRTPDSVAAQIVRRVEEMIREDEAGRKT